MKNKLKFSAISGIIIFLFLTTASYVEPPALLFEHVTSRLATWNGVEMKGELHVFSGGKDSVQSFTLSFAKPGMIRVDSASGSAIKNQARSNPAYDNLPEYRKAAFDLLLYSDQKLKLINLLRNWIIDTTATHMGLLDKDPCIIIGAPEIQTETPQVWFNKDRYWPTRLIIKDYKGDEESIIDIRFTGWDLPMGADIMPSEIEIFVNGVKTEIWKVKAMNRRLGLDHRFDL